MRGRGKTAIETGEVGLAVPCRIWLVGDEPASASQIEAWLAAAGYGCECLDTSEACLRLAAGRPAAGHVIVNAGARKGSLDLLTPFKEAGLQVTLLVEPEDLPAVEAGLHAQVSAFLVKPFTDAALCAVLALPRADVGAPAGGCFPFRTLDDVAALSQLVAGLCPEPETLQIALHELMLNAVEHGNLGLGFERKAELMNSGLWRREVERLLAQPGQRERFAWLRVERRPRALHFLICDQGQGFDPAPYLDLDPARAVEPEGRGIAIARLLAFPDLVFSAGGRCVEGVVRRADFRGLAVEE